MINFINYLVIFNILAWGGIFFPELIVYDKPMKLIMVILIMTIIKNLFGILFIYSGIRTIKSSERYYAITIILFIMVFLSTPLSMFIISRIISGFQVNGFLTYIILSILIEILTLKE